MILEGRASPPVRLNMNETTDGIVSILNSRLSRVEKAKKLADLLREIRGYRWVGIYDVDEHQISVIAWSGIGAPAYPRFRATQGLSGEAVRTRRTVISNDVANDPRYLTAFGNTQSEIIVPIIAEPGGPVIGTIDVESDQTDAFGNDDRLVLEECASLLAQL